MLTCHELTLRRGERMLFQNLGFTAAAGSILIICGDNGSGKTTLLRSIALFNDVDEGEMRWCGDLLVGRRCKIYRQNIAYLGHQNALLANFTVREYLNFWAGMRGTEIMLPAVWETFALHDVLDVKCGELSCGWQKRIALARLMLHNVVLWILDEPLVNLDQKTQNLTMQVLKIRAEQGGIVIFSTNDKSLISPSINILNIANFA